MIVHRLRDRLREVGVDVGGMPDLSVTYPAGPSRCCRKPIDLEALDGGFVYKVCTALNCNESQPLLEKEFRRDVAIRGKCARCDGPFEHHKFSKDEVVGTSLGARNYGFKCSRCDAVIELSSFLRPRKWKSSTPVA
jgi:hypothetical protein